MDMATIPEWKMLVLQIGGFIILSILYLFYRGHHHMQNLKTWATTQQQRIASLWHRWQATQPAATNYRVVTVPGASPAMQNPPASIHQALRYISDDTGINYDMVIGWHYVGDTPHCLSAPLVGDVYHTLISGMSRAGKDNLALNAMIGLALSYRPDQVQFCVIDGKGLDFVGFEGKTHTWHLALKPSEIAGAMEALSSERERRGDVLRSARVAKWESYKGTDMPLLVIYVSELSLLEGAVGKRQLGDWLNQELAAGAAFGLRYIVATQTASNFDTRWRSQISLYLAAFQPSQSQDQPNTGLTTNEIKSLHGIPPSELPAPPKGAGVFTCVQGRDVVVIRAGYMDDQQRTALLDRLPEVSKNGVKSFDTDEKTESVFPAQESDFTSSDVPFSSAEIARIAALIGNGKSKTEVVKAMPGYASRKHAEYVGYYDQIKDML